MGIRCADHVTPLYPQKLALTSPTGGGRSVGIVRSRTKATEFFYISVKLGLLQRGKKSDGFENVIWRRMSGPKRNAGEKYLGIVTPGNWNNQLIVLKEVTILTVTTGANKLTARVNCSGF